MDIKYDFIPDELGEDSHAAQLRAVPHGSRVLELGCATGYISKVLQEHGCRVTGVDVSAEYLERARPYCERVVQADLDRMDLGELLAGEAYDVVLAGDVLEHLVDPGKVLAAVRGLLSPGGQVVATIPNIAHADVRLALGLGRFDYRRLGLLDETHLRFYTPHTGRALFEAAGYVVTALGRIRKPLFASELELDAAMFPEEVVRWVALDPEATTYQFMVVAKPEGEALPPLQDEATPLRQAMLAELLEAKAEAERTRVALAEARAELARREQELQDEHQRLETAVGRFHELEARYQAMRRVSVVNPLVVAPALWRRIRGKGHA